MNWQHLLYGMENATYTIHVYIFRRKPTKNESMLIDSDVLQCENERMNLKNSIQILH